MPPAECFVHRDVRPRQPREDLMRGARETRTLPDGVLLVRWYGEDWWSRWEPLPGESLHARDAMLWKVLDYLTDSEAAS